MALTLKVALVIHTDLAAGIWVLAFINVCGKDHKSEPAGGSVSAWADGGGLTATGLLVHELEACWACALKANLEVSADMGTAAIIVQTLVQPWWGEGGHRLLNSSGRQGSGPEQSQALEQQTPTEPGRQEAALNLSLISQVTGKEEDQRAGP